MFKTEFICHLKYLYETNSSRKGYALGHFGDNSSQVDLVSIHPRPGKKSER